MSNHRTQGVPPEDWTQGLRKHPVELPLTNRGFAFTHISHCDPLMPIAVAPATTLVHDRRSEVRASTSYRLRSVYTPVHLPPGNLAVCTSSETSL